LFTNMRNQHLSNIWFEYPRVIYDIHSKAVFLGGE
jgi:hypothetical protein